MLEKLIKQGESKTLEFKEAIINNTNMIKTICAFANRSGGKLIIGIHDDGKVIGLDNQVIEQYLEKIPNIINDSISPMILPEIYTQSINDKVVLIIEIQSGTAVPYYIKALGKSKGTYIRVGRTNKQADYNMITELERKRMNISYDADIYKEVDQGMINQLKNVLEEAFEEEVTIEKMLTLGVVKREGTIDYLTHGGAIVIGELEHSIIRCARFLGDSSYEFLDRKEYDLDIFEQIKQATNFIVSHLHLAGYFVENNLRRKDELEIPYNIIREAVINSILHRDYSIVGADIKIAVYNSYIDIISPGGLPGTITISEIYTGRSEIRNRVLAKVLLRAHLIEQWGSGIPRIREACKRKGYQLPIMTEDGLFVRLKIYRAAYKKKMIREEAVQYKMVGRDRDEKLNTEIIQLILEDCFITVKGISVAVEIPPATIQRKLAKLQKLGIIKRVGSKKTGYWEVGTD